MLESTFLHTFRQAGAARITKDYILFRKPLQIYNMQSDETVYFNTVEEMFRYRIETGETVCEIIKKAKPRAFWEHTLNGGRGSDSDSWSGGFGHAPGSGDEDNNNRDFPARMNGIIKAKNFEETLKQFRKKHVNDTKEHGVSVDENGFVTSYVHGGATSVAVFGGKGEMVLHNHPGRAGRGGNFSDSDLLATATEQGRGIVAVAPEGNYIFRKGQHFKADKFTKAVKHATIRGKDYDDAAGKWLKRNQKKYGYTYSFQKA